MAENDFDGPPSSLDGLGDLRRFNERQSGETYYVEYWSKMHKAIALVAIDPYFERILEIPGELAMDGFDHPEIPQYLGGNKAFRTPRLRERSEEWDGE